MKKNGIMLFALTLAGAATAQMPASKAPPASAVSPAQAALNTYDEGNYLAASDALAAAAFGPDGKVRDDFAFQMWEQISPTVTGELDPATLDRALPDSRPDPDWEKRVTAATPHDAIDEIVRRARDTRIVIVNEAHDSPRDRAFVLRVARALRPLSFSVLAAETFRNEPGVGGKPTAVERLIADGFVRRGTGFYTRDPVFAGYVREALRLGYRPLAYEQSSKQRRPNDGIPEREQAEADNLAAFLAANPTAKILVHVGYSHVAEAPIDGGRHGKIAWMASRLKHMTGIDPLTIDQTGLSEIVPGARAAWTLAAARIGDRDAVLFAGKQPLVLGQYAGAVDLQVVHPRRAYRDGRPTWLTTLGGTSVAVPAKLLPTSGRRLIQAYAAGAPDDAVPLDQVLVEAGKPVPMLMLPPGPVRFAVQQ